MNRPSVSGLRSKLAFFRSLALGAVAAAAIGSAAAAQPLALGPGCGAKEYLYLEGRAVVVASDASVLLRLTPAAVTTPESGAVTFTVTLESSSGPLACPVTVGVMATPGTATSQDGDYGLPAPTTLQFNPGDATGAARTVSIPITPDTRYEGNETFGVALVDPRGGRVASSDAVVTIVDDDPRPTISVEDLSVPEGSTSASVATVTVRLSNESAFPVSVSWATSDGTAAAPGDYAASSGTATVPGRALTTTLSIPLVADATYEANESFVVTLSNPAGGTLGDAVGVVTLLNDDPAPTIRVTDAFIVESDVSTVQAVFTVSTTGATDLPIGVSYATPGCTASEGFDFTPVSGTLSLAAGGSATVAVDVLPDTLAERDETFTLQLSGPVNATLADATATGWISDNDRTTRLSPRADFNLDGKTDLIFRNDASGNHVVWTMEGPFRTGGGALSPAQPASGNWRLVGAGSFDLDRDADLLWQNVDSGNLSFWLMNGMTRETGVALSGLGVDWKVAATADFNGDGKIDVFWRNSVTGELKVWYMNGTAIDTVATPNPSTMADLNWQLAGVGDLDGDRHPDLVWRHQVSGALAYWLLSGVERIGGGFLSPSSVADLNWKVVGLWDLDLDGRSDLIWQNQQSGEMNAWLMDGTSRRCLTSLVPDRPVDAGWKAVGPR